MGSSKMSKTEFLGAIFVEKLTIYYKYLKTKLNKNTHFNSISKLKMCLRKDDAVLITWRKFLGNVHVIINNLNYLHIKSSNWNHVKTNE